MVELLNILLNSSRELTDNEQYGYYVRELLEESKNEVGDIKKLNLLSKNIINQIKHNKMVEIPTHDPQTGELNPYYEELTEKKNPLTKDKDLDKMPNQKWHQIVSFIKSGVRIIGYCLIPYNLLIAAIVLVISEVIGVIEELV